MALCKAVVPAAGRGTRFLPASKAVPKEMIPIVDRPAIQYVVEEAVAAGLTDIAFIVGEGKGAIASHFAPDPGLEAYLEERDDADRLEEVRRAAALGSFTYLTQDEPLGLGHAVSIAEDHVGGEAFAVLLADDFCDERDPALAAMIALHELTGQSVILLLEVSPERIQAYGCADPVPLSVDDIAGAAGDSRIPSDIEIHTVARVNEKPAPGEEYSNLALIGRYVLTPAVFDVLHSIPPGRGGEIQLTDAIDRLARMPVDDGGGVLGVVFQGRRYDTGDRLGYLKATVEIATDRVDLGPEFREWLSSFVEEGEGR